jgi:CRISPR-associated protein (TIGR03986 family)
MTGSTYYPAPAAFASCQDNTKLCIACRLFGMMQRGRDAKVFLGKVNIGDASAYEDTLDFYEPLYTAVLDTPKPRHRAFYLNERGEIAGRKFYFHHSGKPRSENRLLEIRNRPGTYRNQHIEPLAPDTEFDARIDFTNLDADEFAALLYAVTLESDMRHKIGYGKPIGLGTVRIDATQLQLVDYATRYANIRSGRGLTTYDMDQIAALVAEQMASVDPQISAAWQGFRAQPAIRHLATIWQWPPDSSVVYCYPSQRWFKEHSQARIAETRDLYPGE